MTHIVAKAAAILGGGGLSLVLLATAAHATAAAPPHRVRASCTMSDGQKATFELKYRTSGGYHRVSDILYSWNSEVPIRLRTGHLRLMVERRGSDRKVFEETLHEKETSNDVSYDLVVDVKVPAARKLYLVVDSTYVKKGRTLRCAGRTAGV
ncbi:hypothetical protein ACFFV7_21540 [Nonomuraea spiralis]|uniref:Uncharacterized protein n=1 Tax=Nonomuraea spiralis TaxID=46182 RepID=A0ABV5IJ80_9ACTN|nr:hypothetical protein [Nonomuraea spiralis]GGS97660.1 hypothetical protein GCM10010176_046930 [Nonomuraea spiralis]